MGMASDREVLKHDGVRHIVNEGGSGSDPENGIPVLPTRQEDLVASEEANPHTTPDGGKGGPSGS